MSVAAGNINGDAYADIITGAGPGGGPNVRVFDGASNAVLRDFFAFAPNFSGGVNVGAADINGDGLSDILTGTASQTAQVNVFDGATNNLVRGFTAYPSFTGGVSVAGGDIDGDGKADIITGAGPGGGANVRVFAGVNNAVLRDYFVYDTFVSAASPFPLGGGVSVAAADFDGDGLADILTGRGVGSRPFALVVKGTTLDHPARQSTPSATGTATASPSAPEPAGPRDHNRPAAGHHPAAGAVSTPTISA